MIDFEAKRRERAGKALVEYGKLLERSVRYILGRPHVKYREAIELLAKTLANLITIMPVADRQSYLIFAIAAIKEQLDNNLKK